MPMYSDEELLAAIDQLADKYGRPPTLQELRTETTYSGRVYFSRFGSWRDALEAAGYESRPPQEALSKRELIEELQRLGDELGRAPSVREMDDQGAYWGSTYQNHFGSWRDALEAAGYDPDETAQYIGRENLLAELRRLGEELGKQPTFREMEADGAYDPKTYVREFGSWTAALEAAGYDPDETARDIGRENLLADLRALAADLDKQPSQRDMNEHGDHSHTTYVRHFESWSNAIDAAFADE